MVVKGLKPGISLKNKKSISKDLKGPKRTLGILQNQGWVFKAERVLVSRSRTVTSGGRNDIVAHWFFCLQLVLAPATEAWRPILRKTVHKMFLRPYPSTDLELSPAINLTITMRHEHIKRKVAVGLRPILFPAQIIAPIAYCETVSRLDLEWRGGSIGTASDSRSNANGFHDPSSNPVRSTSKTYEFFPSQTCRADSLSVCPPPPCVYARIRMITHARYRSCNLCQSSVDYGTTKRPSMHV